MDSLISQIKSLAETADEAGRKSIRAGLEELQSQLESPMDTFLKLHNSVWPSAGAATSIGHVEKSSRICCSTG